MVGGLNPKAPRPLPTPPPPPNHLLKFFNTIVKQPYPLTKPIFEKNYNNSGKQDHDEHDAHDDHHENHDDHCNNHESQETTRRLHQTTDMLSAKTGAVVNTPRMLSYKKSRDSADYPKSFTLPPPLWAKLLSRKCWRTTLNRGTPNSFPHCCDLTLSKQTSGECIVILNESPARILCK